MTTRTRMNVYFEPELLAQLGREVSDIVQSRSVSWQLGRQRGLYI